MSYDKQNWQTGDVITANKLNHIEDGIAGAGGGGGVLVVSAVYDEQTDTTTLDKTWQEIHDATVPIMVQENPLGKMFAYVGFVGQTQNEYFVLFANYSADEVVMSTYACNSANDYPVLKGE